LGTRRSNYTSLGPGSASAEFFDIGYPVPVSVVAGKSKVTVRFQSTGGNEIAAVFGLRMIRADAPLD